VANDSTDLTPGPSAERRTYVVGIGASSGGPAALQALLGTLPPDPGFACVVVMHLSPEHESLLPELLQQHSRMPVQQVTATTVLEPDRVYLISPNANLETIDTHLRLTQIEERRIERAPIDHFLRTLAATHAGTAIGVILTGTGSDGSMGLCHIKECGGLAIAQDPQEAAYSSMPRSAIATGRVDLVLRRAVKRMTFWRCSHTSCATRSPPSARVLRCSRRRLATGVSLSE
jgi:two-component system CheB/CheR fusion protein